MRARRITEKSRAVGVVLIYWDLISATPMAGITGSTSPRTLRHRSMPHHVAFRPSPRLPRDIQRPGHPKTATSSSIGIYPQVHNNGDRQSRLTPRAGEPEVLVCFEVLEFLTATAICAASCLIFRQSEPQSLHQLRLYHNVGEQIYERRHPSLYRAGDFQRQA